MATKEDFERFGEWAVMKNPDLKIDRRGHKRVVPMQVLSLGFPRTGTLSMCEALRILGIPAYHFSSIIGNPRDADMWEEAFRAKKKGRPYGHFDELLGHVGAITDAPAICFWEELLDAYPDAKVVLVERDEQKWFKSASILYDGQVDPLVTWVLRYTDPEFLGRANRLGFSYMRDLYGTVYGAKDVMIERYREHYARIRAKVPKERLLEYKLGDWEKLCQFLGKDVPDVPFPHRNEAGILEAAFAEASFKAMSNSMRNVGGVLVALGVAVMAVMWARR